MQSFLETLNAAAALWTERVWGMVWQSTILVVAAALLAGLLLRRSAPAVRYWVWQILAVKILLMPFWTYALPLPQFLLQPKEEVASLSSPPVAAGATPPEETGPLPDAVPATPKSVQPSIQDAAVPTALKTKLHWQAWLFIGWGVIVVAQVARLIGQRRRLVRVLRAAQPADGPLAEAVRETAARLALARTPEAVLTDADCSPFVCGIRRPVIVLPRKLAASLGPTELNHVLLHELAHVRRHDLVWGWIGEIALVVYFFHPVVHWIGYRARLERELACDAIAMSLSGQNAGEYAATLVRVVSQSSEPTVFKTAAASAGMDGGKG
jgi:beta-lactamase regulating signal transducer with metallopeptidase domain